MIISLLLLLPVYISLAWIDRYLQRQGYGRVDIMAQILVVSATVLTVVVTHILMLEAEGIWPYVLAPVAAYLVMLISWSLTLLGRKSTRHASDRSARSRN